MGTSLRSSAASARVRRAAMAARHMLVGLSLGAADRVSRRAKDTVTLVLNQDVLDADTLSLVLNARELTHAPRLCLLVRSQHRFVEVNASYLPRLAESGKEIAVVEAASAACVGSLLRTRLLLLTSFEDIPIHRVFLRAGGRRVVRIYHGLITKSYGRLMSEPESGLTRSLMRVLGAERGIDVRSVASDVELHFRAAAEGSHPSTFRKWGYPRYDRAEDLLENRRTPVLPDPVRRLLEGSGRRNILYAPTHRDGRYATTLFPFPDFDAGALRAFLREYELNLLLRMHVTEERSAAYRDLVDGEFVHDAGRSWSPSALELLPHVHMLVTDYSSIYMDFLPFDRPMLFVRADKDAFDRFRGLAFEDETFFPGVQIGSMQALLAAVRRHLVCGKDEHARSRELVRRVLLPPREHRFMEHLNRLLGGDSAVGMGT